MIPVCRVSGKQKMHKLMIFCAYFSLIIDAIECVINVALLMIRAKSTVITIRSTMFAVQSGELWVIGFKQALNGRLL